MQKTGRLRILVVGLVLAAVAIAVEMAVVYFGAGSDPPLEATKAGGEAPAPVVLAEAGMPVATPIPSVLAKTGVQVATATPVPSPIPSPTATPGSGNLMTNAQDGLREAAGTLISGAIPD